MTQEDKQLLLRDFCARLPYGVKVKYIFEDGSHCPFELSIKILQECLDKAFKPYLRPMSSMTEEEKEEYDKFFTTITAKEANFGKWISPTDDIALIDWYNKHHFDYRGLIEKGLAIEVTEKTILMFKKYCYMCERYVGQDPEDYYDDFDEEGMCPFKSIYVNCYDEQCEDAITKSSYE